MIDYRPATIPHKLWIREGVNFHGLKQLVGVHHILLDLLLTIGKMLIAKFAKISLDSWLTMKYSFSLPFKCSILFFS